MPRTNLLNLLFYSCLISVQLKIKLFFLLVSLRTLSHRDRTDVDKFSIRNDWNWDRRPVLLSLTTTSMYIHSLALFLSRSLRYFSLNFTHSCFHFIHTIQSNEIAHNWNCLYCCCFYKICRQKMRLLIEMKGERDREKRNDQQE